MTHQPEFEQASFGRRFKKPSAAECSLVYSPSTYFQTKTERQVQSVWLRTIHYPLLKQIIICKIWSFTWICITLCSLTHCVTLCVLFCLYFLLCLVTVYVLLTCVPAALFPALIVSQHLSHICLVSTSHQHLFLVSLHLHLIPALVQFVSKPASLPHSLLVRLFCSLPHVAPVVISPLSSVPVSFPCFSCAPCVIHALFPREINKTAAKPRNVREGENGNLFGSFCVIFQQTNRCGSEDTKVWKGIQDVFLYVMIIACRMNIRFCMSR